MGYKIRVTVDAELDIVDLYEYIAFHDCVENAEYVLNEIEKLILSLDENPLRGRFPPELSEQGIKDFKEVWFKPYRVIYQVVASEVVVLCCLDGRQDMQSLLERRLLR